MASSEVGVSSTLRQRETLSHEKCSFQRHKVTVFGIFKGTDLFFLQGTHETTTFDSSTSQHEMTFQHNVKLKIEQRSKPKLTADHRSLSGHLSAMRYHKADQLYKFPF
ncbi:uncharacterized protein Bfra_006831 [Botrytis fragariae]|uniref:Uncharacterized protein n=1 Tax=Botrytis fragariae TaxID=1964551 RepID=A0A8H6B563_9HELO|nr:uncharacterized protein Bfra_006831 [Botrytis fragariae]KAF5879624.1 hypothetical protein Bfra_006831 [Botrytis fragariae]